MVNQHYRWDFIGLSTDTKPTPEDSEKVVDGSTFYCSDTSKLYVFYKNTWYEKVVSGGGSGTSDFDQLSNRPKYNGTTMSSTTNIPEVKDVNDYAIKGAGAPTTSTEGTVGLIYEDTTNGKLYQCTAVTPGTDPDPDTYTWSEVGGSSVTVVQTTGTSTTDVMSQNATTSMIFADPGTKTKVQIGNSDVTGDYAIGIGPNVQAQEYGSVAIGTGARITQASGLAIGREAKVTAQGAVALGAMTTANIQGQINVAPSKTWAGYNNTLYRLLTGLYDGSSAHDAATYGQLNTRLGGLTLLSISQTDYDNLGTYDPNTLYVITGA